MALLSIKLYPDPILNQVCSEVTQLDDNIQKLCTDMAETMYKSRGIGLAAPQVGILQRVIVVDVSDERNELVPMINPKITWSEGKVTSEEGCLSIPDYRDTISRKKSIKVEAITPKGEHFQLEADGLLAICIQHEIDHLDGILFIQRLSRLKRELFKRWFNKQQNNPEGLD